MINVGVHFFQFALIASFAIAYMELPENVGKPVSAMVLAAFFLLLLGECIITKTAHLKLYVVKKSENAKAYHLVLLFHFTIALILTLYFLTHLDAVQAFNWKEFRWLPLRWSK